MKIGFLGFESVVDCCKIAANNNKPKRQFTMRKSLVLIALAHSTLAGCMDDPATRGLAGAATGAVLADATDNNVLTGAIIGGLAGAASCTLPAAQCPSGY